MGTTDAVGKLVYKVEQCIDYQNLWAMEKDFNKCGLTIQTTSNNRMILAKLRNGKPVTNEVVTDYIFVGSLKDPTKDISDRAILKICDFVRNASSKSGTVKNMPRVWRDGLRMYGYSVFVKNEDVNVVADSIQE